MTAVRYRLLKPRRLRSRFRRTALDVLKWWYFGPRAVLVAGRGTRRR